MALTGQCGSSRVERVLSGLTSAFLRARLFDQGCCEFVPEVLVRPLCALRLLDGTHQQRLFLRQPSHGVRLDGASWCEIAHKARLRGQMATVHSMVDSCRVIADQACISARLLPEHLRCWRHGKLAALLKALTSAATHRLAMVQVCVQEAERATALFLPRRHQMRGGRVLLEFTSTNAASEMVAAVGRS